MPTTDWDNLEGGGWQIRPWAAWKQALPGWRFVLSVPLLPGAWNLSGPKTGMEAGKAVSLEAGAQGDYNRHFKILAECLVKAGPGDEAVDEVGLDVYDQCWQPGTYPIPTNAPPADVLAEAGQLSPHEDAPRSDGLIDASAQPLQQ